MKKTLIALSLLTSIILTACSTSGGDKNDGNPIVKVSIDGSTPAIGALSSRVSYVDLTYTGKKPIDTVWMKASTKSSTSMVIDQCLKPWVKDKCKDGTVSVLPAIGLSGWNNSLATANTPMITGQTRHLRFTSMKPAKVAMEFSTASTTP